MQDDVEEQLLALNRAFYRVMAAPFAETRARPQPGFYDLLAHLPRPCPRLLDVGCGEGRLGRFFQARSAVSRYVGVDFSAELLETAWATTSGTFWARDISKPGCLDGLGEFDAIACLATLQHIPGRDNRRRLLQEMGAHLAPAGRLLLSTWQFMDSERQRRKVSAWENVGLSAAAVEDNDYLLTWQRDGFHYRYVCYIDAAEIAALAAPAGVTITHRFRNDGKEGDLNLYTVLRRAGPATVSTATG